MSNDERLGNPERHLALGDKASALVERIRLAALIHRAPLSRNPADAGSLVVRSFLV